MRSETIQQIYNLLNRLEQDVPSKVTYDEVNNCLTILQRGRVIQLKPLQGLMICKSNNALLNPSELSLLINNLRFLLQYSDDLLFVPKDLGFDVYCRELKELFKPKLLMELNFYSIKSPILLWLVKKRSRYIRSIMKL